MKTISLLAIVLLGLSSINSALKVNRLEQQVSDLRADVEAIREDAEYVRGAVAMEVPPAQQRDAWVERAIARHKLGCN